MRRRDFMAASAAAGLSIGPSATAKSSESQRYDLEKPADLLECHVKLRGSLDNRVVIWWIRARQYAVVDTVLVPLFDLLNASFQRFTRLDQGGYAIAMLELAYFTDLASGAPLDQFRNPFTDKLGTVPPAMFGPNRVTLTTAGLQPPENFPFGALTFEGDLGPGYSDGEDLWMREDTIVRMTSDNPAFGNYIYNERVGYRGAVADIDDADMPSAPATLTYNTTSNWRPWMQAGDTPGHIMANGFGKKVRAVDELPPDYLAIARARHPQVLDDAVNMLDSAGKS